MCECYAAQVTLAYVINVLAVKKCSQHHFVMLVD